MESPFRDHIGAISLLRKSVWFLRRLKVLGTSLGKLSIGRQVVFGRNTDIRPYRYATIGSNVAIGKNFTAETDFILGDNILISSNVSFIARDHRFSDPNIPIYWQGRTDGLTVEVAGNNLIGFGVILVAPCRVGQGTIIGAGSVVVSDLPENTICAGVPARVIRSRHTMG